MKILKWKEEKSKKLELKMRGGTASLHFVKGKNVYVPNCIWDEMSKKLSDPINTGRLEINDYSENYKSKNKKKIEDEEINIKEL